jgi:CheY-like chemotaxis protein
LLVDDDDAVLGLYSSSLSLSGEFRVLLAHTGTEALRLLGEQCPALVVTDIQMPDLDGLELIGRIRQGPAPVRGVPIVALTALAMAGDRERCLAAGADVVRNKPIPLKELRALILQWVAPPAPSLAPGSNPQTAASVPPNSP